jgi:hypothetical protein
MSPRVPASRPTFTREQALMVAEAAGIDVSRPMVEQVGGPADDVRWRLAALAERVERLAAAQGLSDEPEATEPTEPSKPATPLAEAEALASELAHAQCKWHTFGGIDG